jgi:UDP-N-acetyl-D-glucosamine dehydrogenase
MTVNYQQQLIDKFKNRTARVAILGMGYVGLPLAVVFAEAGFEVTGIDPVESKVAALNRGESYILDVDQQQVRRLVEQGRLKATTDYSALQFADAV